MRGSRKTTFDSAPVAIIEDDVSGVFALFRRLRSEGVRDLLAYLSEHPVAAREVFEGIRMLAANAETLRIFGAADLSELDAHRGDVFADTGAFAAAMGALFQGDTEAEFASEMRRLDGTSLFARGRLALRFEEDSERLVYAILDVTSERDAEARRVAQLERLRAIEALSAAAAEAVAPADVPRKMVEAVRRVFDADRVFLVYPCDPSATAFTIQESAAVAPWDLLGVGGRTLPMDPGTAKNFRESLAADRPVVEGPPPPPEFRAQAEAFGTRSQATVALRPRFGSPWLLGLHQCSYDRHWTPDELHLLAEVGHKLADALSSAALWERLLEQATRDELTGLPNRRALEDRLAAAVLSAEQGAEHALCYLDLDQFKIVNDTAGHASGDAMLRALAEVLSAGVRGGDLLARLGGDEFGLLLEGCPLERAEAIARTLVERVRDYRFEAGGRVFEVGVSIGVVPITRTSESPGAIMSRADVACYAAKDRGRNSVHVYREGDRESARRHRDLYRAATVADVVREEGLVLFTQPIVPLSSGSDVEHSEILLRVLDAQGSPGPPSLFISAAERFGLMGQVDRWVFDQVWPMLPRHPAGPRARVSMNLSGNSLSDGNLLDYMAERLSEPGYPADRLCFEITETAAISRLGPARGFIERMRGLGCRFALDDFGSGISSFGYLKELPVDYLKIDGGFVKDIADTPFDRAMVAAVQQLAASLGIRTIAEWVESADALELVRSLGVDYAQGFHVGVPRPLG